MPTLLPAASFWNFSYAFGTYALIVPLMRFALGAELTFVTSST